MAKHRERNDNSAALAPCFSMAAWNGPMMAAFSHAGAVCTKGCVEWQQEFTRFVGARLEEDRRAQQTLRECRSFEDVAKVQQSWMQAAAKAYADEAGNLTQIASRWALGMAPSLNGERISGPGGE